MLEQLEAEQKLQLEEEKKKAAAAQDMMRKYADDAN